jgi:hypothetical protein
VIEGEMQCCGWTSWQAHDFGFFNSISAIANVGTDKQKPDYFNTMRIFYRVVKGKAAARLAIEIKW